MKLKSFKFQDGKVFWLPEYPESRPMFRNFSAEANDKLHYEDELNAYDEAVAQSLASTIEVAPEDREKVEYYIKLYIITRNPGVGSILYHNLWQPEKGKVYSAECEMEAGKQGICCSPLEGGINHHGYCDECPNYTERQVARLKPKDEISPAANSHDRKEELWDFSSTQEAKDFLRYYFKRYHAMRDEAIEILIFEEVEGFRKTCLTGLK